MKNFDLNELLNSSMKNMANNYKTEAPPWFMPGQTSFQTTDSSILFNSLLNQMVQYAIFNSKTVHRFSIYFPEERYDFKNLDEVIKIIKEEEKSLKLIYRSENSITFVSQDEILSFDHAVNTINVASFNGTKLKSLKDKLKSVGQK
jgi:hypothetical protein